jgi:hypothetical protein
VVGGGVPEHDKGATAAEMVTGWLKFDGLGVLLRVTVADPFTTCTMLF